MAGLVQPLHGWFKHARPPQTKSKNKQNKTEQKIELIIMIISIYAYIVAHYPLNPARSIQFLTYTEARLNLRSAYFS